MTMKKMCIWLTGLSGSGKSTIAEKLNLNLKEKGYHSYVLDGDKLRDGLNKDLGFSDEHRKENIRRAGEVSKLFFDAGLVVIVAFISPFRTDRQMIRNLYFHEDFVEVFVDAPLDVCEKRDPKGLYKKARQGNLREFTGIDSVYEVPLTPDIHLKNYDIDPDQSLRQVIEYLNFKGFNL